MPLADYLTGFYVQPALDYKQTFRPGQLYFAPTFYLPAHPDVLYEVAEDPTEERLRFEIRRMGPRSFRDAHRPLATIGLASSEELVAIKAKKRLVVLLSQENFVAEALGGRVARAAKIHERSLRMPSALRGPPGRRRAGLPARGCRKDPGAHV